MNAARRKKLSEILSKIEAASADLDAVKEEEQEAFDNLSEGLQQSEQGQNAEAAVQAMDNAMQSLNDAGASIEEAQGT